MLREMRIRAGGPEDREWLGAVLRTQWGLPVVSVSGPHDPSAYPFFVAEEGGERVGVVTYLPGEGDCEVLTLNSFRQGRGVGSALLDAVALVARDNGWRLWLITTNDNIRAIRFYQQRGMDMVALHRDFVETVCRAKPGIDRSGHDGIGFRHAIEFSY
jgi:GNAT superfamily N-acetyltransferase